MKRLTPKKLRIGLVLRLYKKGKQVFSSRFQIKHALLAKTEPKLWDKAYIKVLYNNKHYNDGYYSTMKDLKYALRVFTEKDLLDYFEK